MKSFDKKFSFTSIKSQTTVAVLLVFVLSSFIGLEEIKDPSVRKNESTLGGTGTATDPFTSLTDAYGKTPGVYHFNLNGTTPFSTYVDANGYVQVAIDFGNGIGNLSQSTALTNATRGILTAPALSSLSNINNIRISHSGGNFDVTTTNPTLISRVTTNTTLHQGLADNTINDDWTGTEATAITVDATGTSSSALLNEVVVHVAGRGDGFHWRQNVDQQRIRYSSGTFFGEIANTESFTLWVQGNPPAPGGIWSDLQLWLKADVGGTSWTDQSGNGVTVTQAGTGISASTLNFNAANAFAASGHYDTSLSINSGTHPDLSVISVYVPAVDFPGAAWGEDNGGWDRFILDSNVHDRAVSTGTGASYNVTNLFNTNQPTLATVTFDEDTASGSFVYVNGNLERTFTSNHGPEASNTLEVGALGGSNFLFNGRIAETIVYSQLLDGTNARTQIESYLALKYGITLNSSANDYLNSAGSSVYDLTATTYNNDVFGIGKDVLSTLDQRISKSVNSGSVVTLSTDTDFTSANSTHNDTLTNGQFLVVGNDGEDATSQASTEFDPTQANTRIDREWRVENTGSVGTVNLQFDGFDDSYFLLTDADGNFSSGATNAGTLSESGEIALTLTDGVYFTLAQTIPAPGGVSSNLQLWLKADDGVVESGGVVSQWNDQSQSGLNATQGTSSNRPSVSSAEQNFNPMITFDGSNDFFSSNFMPSIVNSDLSFVTVSNRRSSKSNNYFLGQNGPNITNQNLHYGYRYNNTFTEAFWGNDINVTIPVFSSFTPENAGISLSTHSSSNGKYTSWSQAASLSEETKGTAVGNLSSTAIGYVGRAKTVFYNGDLAEVIIYSQELGTSDQQKIRSYLALKYGISLDASSNEYLNSSGSSVYSLATYNNDVFGIGKDTNSTLDQRISKSVNSGSVVTLSTDTDFTSANSTHTNTLTDGQYLVIGNNGEAATSQASTEFDPAQANTRIDREWRVENTGSVGTVNLQFDGFDDSYFLLTDADGNFSSGATNVGTLSASGTIALTLNDGEFFTLAQMLPAPGGIASNLQLWLKADSGVTESGGDVSAWADQSGNTADMSQGTAASQPDLTALAANFNPSVTFDGADDNLSGVNVINGTTARSVFVVYDPDVIDPDVLISLGQGTAGTRWAFTPEVGLRISGSVKIWGDPQGAGGNRISSVQHAASANISTPDAYFNGLLASQTFAIPGGTINTINTPTFIGSSDGGSDQYSGSIAEIVAYDRDVSVTERNQINTYLALKYGITLDSSANDYLSSTASSVYDLTSTIYNNDVFGIAKDGFSYLDQRISKSVNSNTVLTISTDTDFTSANVSHTDTLTDGQYLVIGNDGGDPAMQTSTEYDPAQVGARIDREWRAENTGSVGAINLQFDGFDDSYFLLTDTDGDFSSGAVNAGALNASGEISITLNDGEFFTIAEVISERLFMRHFKYFQNGVLQKTLGN